MVKNKRGWIKIVEAFIAIILILGSLLVTLESAEIGIRGSLPEIYGVETTILRDLQLDSTTRDLILDSSIPTSWENLDPEITGLIEDKSPNYIECKAEICSPYLECITDYEKSNIYAKDIFIGADYDTYSPRRFKISCWEK
jgi:hypothetical protein